MNDEKETQTLGNRFMWEVKSTFIGTTTKIAIKTAKKIAAKAVKKEMGKIGETGQFLCHLNMISGMQINTKISEKF